MIYRSSNRAIAPRRRPAHACWASCELTPVLSSIKYLRGTKAPLTDDNAGRGFVETVEGFEPVTRAHSGIERNSLNRSVTAYFPNWKRLKRQKPVRLPAACDARTNSQAPCSPCYRDGSVAECRSHSYRKTVLTSIRDARVAGIKTAAAAIVVSSSRMAPMTRTLFGVTSKSNDRSSRLEN